MSRGRHTDRRGASAQQGIVMWVALVVLIIMSLAGLAMLRQMGGGVAIAGNIAFKQNATSSADVGTEAARAWIMAQGTATLQVDAPALGYFASWGPSVDPTTFDWTNAGSVEVLTDVPVGNTARYVIHRLCQAVGSVQAAGQVCSDLEDNLGRSQVSQSYGSGVAQTPAFKPFFRLTTRVVGPRNTISYTQVLMH